MPWYYVYEQASGNLLTSGALLGPTVPTNPTLGYLLLHERVDETLQTWNPETKGFEPRALGDRYVLSQLEFTRRFTATEDGTLELMAIDPATSLAVRAQLNTLNKRINRASMIDLQDPETIAGVGAASLLLQQAGVWTEAQAVTRVAAILAPAVD